VRVQHLQHLHHQRRLQARGRRAGGVQRAAGGEQRAQLRQRVARQRRAWRLFGGGAAAAGAVGAMQEARSGAACADRQAKRAARPARQLHRGKSAGGREKGAALAHVRTKISRIVAPRPHFRSLGQLSTRAAPEPV
jgi:hypothetical protein